MFDQTPHVAVPVQVLNSSNQVVATMLSDESGKYRVENLAPGQYQLRCHVLAGFQYYVAPNESQFVAAGSGPESEITAQRSRNQRAEQELRPTHSAELPHVAG